MKSQHLFYYLAVLAVLFMACKETDNEKTNGEITYPATGSYGDNILSDHVTLVYTNTEYSMKADIPEKGNLIIILKGWLWFYSSGYTNWSITEYNDDTMSQEFMALVSGKPCDLLLEFDGKEQSPTDQTYITVEYYENDAKAPTKVKQLKLLSSN